MTCRKPKFPVFDAHTHLANDAADIALDVMDSVGLTAMNNLTGGTTQNFQDGIDALRGKYPKRLSVMCTFDFESLDDPAWPELQADGLEAAIRAGGSGLKELKRLGLVIRHENGDLLKLDDEALDPTWDRCGKLGAPVCIHTTDPLAFHKPLSLYNERCVELQAHPDWVFMKPGLPSKNDLLEARSRVIARHPKTNFVCLHVANFPEDLVTVAMWLEEHPNMYIDIAARIVELGRHHPEMVRNFFIRYQDRILFGTDTGLSSTHAMLGVSMPADEEFFQRDDFKEAFLFPHFDSIWRYLETDDYYIAPPSPVQGNWPCHGIALPDDVLEKVYSGNARRLFANWDGWESFGK